MGYKDTNPDDPEGGNSSFETSLQTNAVIQWLEHLIRNREIGCSNLGPGIGYFDQGFREFPQPLQGMLR